MLVVCEREKEELREGGRERRKEEVGEGVREGTIEEKERGSGPWGEGRSNQRERR